MKVVLSPNPYRDRGLRAAQAAEKILRNVGVETAMCLPFLLEGSNLEFPKHIQFKDTQEELKNADMLVCFGGDGTILHAAKDANAHKVPILGVNLGSVGFMAELEQSELSMLSKLAAGKYTIESRMMLDVAVRRDGKVLFNDIALNDAALTKGAVARVVDLEVYGDKVMIANFSADGVIVSTPTGSTAYSMSAGGPIVEPTAENMIVTPICPHALSARSIVLGRERTVSIKMGKQSRKTAYLSVDGGKAFRLGSGDVVELKMSSSKTRLVRVTGRSFYDTKSETGRCQGVKGKRQQEILRIIEEQDIDTQDQLLAELRARGLQSTQATISRDIKELHLIKELTGYGTYRYAVSERKASLNVASRLRTIFKEGVISFDLAQNIIVLKTMPGVASAACAAIDGMEITGLVGSLAGDDTAMLVMRTNEDAQEFCNEIHTMLK